MPSIALDPGRPKRQPAPPLPQIPIPAPMATSRQVARASATRLCTATSHWIARAVAAGHPLRRPLVLALLVLVLVLTSLGRLERWVTWGGLAMVALSVLGAALQEMKLSKIVPSSYNEFLDHQMDHCSGHLVMLPHLSPVKSCATAKLQQLQQQRPQVKDVVTSTTVNIAPSMASPSSAVPSNAVQQEETERQDTSGAMKAGAVKSMAGPPPASAGSCSRAADGSNKLDVRHCGTIIDVQGSHGFIIPHDIGVDVRVVGGTSARSSAVAGRERSGKHRKMPFVIPFKLNEAQTAARQGIAVGKTVEFAYAQVAAAAGADAPGPVCARNVTPVCTDDGIRKSRSALQSCKQAREVSFARAMEELTMISLRNVPVKHHVDLIKYAEKLDDQHETRLDQCIF